MSPTANGRQCGQCDKEIHDFSAMSWPAIARTQAEHGNALCGMYTPAQLAHWGQRPPPSACAKLAAATALALSLSSLPALAQTPAAAAPGKIVVSGTVTTTSAMGKPEPVPGATVLLQGTNIGVSTDADGRYELVLPDSVSGDSTSILSFSGIGYVRSKWVLLPQSHGLVQHDALLTEDNTQIAYSVLMPTVTQRVKWTLKRWFGRKSPLNETLAEE